MHLEQRVVQRLLSRFTAQGLFHHDLSRACMAQTTDAVPRVLLLDGWLCMVQVRRGSTKAHTCHGPMDRPRRKEGRTHAL